MLGLTFKPDTDDMRDAPSIPLVTGLIDMGAKVKAFDPVGMEQAKNELPSITYCEDAYAWVMSTTLTAANHGRGVSIPNMADKGVRLLCATATTGPSAIHGSLGLR